MAETSTRTSEGQRRLCALVTPPITAADLARILKVSRASVSLWALGKATPTRARAAAIEKATGIPAATWGEAPVKAEKKARRAK